MIAMEAFVASKAQRKSSKSTWWTRGIVTLGLLASSIPHTSAQSCISLANSTQCQAFNASSVSIGPSLTALYPFLAFVSDTTEFDHRLADYIATSYVQTKYQQLLGCTNVTLLNTTSFYARYTTSVICNAIVQNSITPCGLSTATSRPLCADTCAQAAINEEEIAADKALCGSPGPHYLDQIRADFTNCALPSNSLAGSCITGELNEPDNCGYASNLRGLCNFCASSSPNATDSCCQASNVTAVCVGVALPPFATLPPLFPPATSATASPSATGAVSNASSNNALSGGAIAGIVIGSIVGGAILLALLLLCLSIRRRRRGSQHSALFNQSSPRRSGVQPGMVFTPHDTTTGPGAVPAGRVARMTALERDSSDDRANPILAAEQQGQYVGASDSDNYNERAARGVAGQPVTSKRNGSLSSNSIFGGLEASPHSDSNGQFSSPEGLTSGQSEQLPFFKDYYSNDEIHPNDRVATLWAYQPRAGDEFELERGDMLKVVGIWDDGWATGIRVSDRAEDWEAKKLQRDSGVSGSSVRREPSPSPEGDIKAFPLVCVCLPQHWRKTIEGDSNASENGAGGPPQGFGNF